MICCIELLFANCSPFTTPWYSYVVISWLVAASETNCDTYPTYSWDPRMWSTRYQKVSKWLQQNSVLISSPSGRKHRKWISCILPKGHVTYTELMGSNTGLVDMGAYAYTGRCTFQDICTAHKYVGVYTHNAGNADKLNVHTVLKCPRRLVENWVLHCTWWYYGGHVSHVEISTNF